MTIQDAIDRLRERTRMTLFAADVWDPELDARLKNASAEELFEGFRIGNPQMAACAIAGLHLWNDNFHASHNLCQGIDTQAGSYWHGLCHRREGHQGEGLSSNLSNARYWFRRVGEHPAFDAVYRSALGTLDGAGASFRWAEEAATQLRSHRRWDATVLIDWVGQADAHTLPAQAEELISEIQWREIDLLVDWCFQQAVSAS
jgi:hypothetical protein